MKSQVVDLLTLIYLSHFAYPVIKSFLCCLMQQHLTNIQRQKSEVLAATSSYYDSFLDVIEFRVCLSVFSIVLSFVVCLVSFLYGLTFIFALLACMDLLYRCVMKQLFA